MTIEELNSCCPYNVRNGIRIIKRESGYCQVEVQMTEETLNPYGTTHGGIIFSACDTAACVAGYDGETLPVTQTSSMSFVRPGRCTKITAEARCVYNGKHTTVAHVDVFSENRHLLATGEFTMIKSTKIHVVNSSGENA